MLLSQHIVLLCCVVHFVFVQKKMFRYRNSAVRGTKRARELIEESNGPTILSELTLYCVDFAAHQHRPKDPWFPSQLFYKLPYDIKNIKMNEMLTDWTERLKKFPSRCCPIETAEINPVTSAMKLLLKTSRGDIVEMLNTGPRPLKPADDVYVYPPLWSDSFDPRLLEILDCQYLPNMTMSGTEHAMFVNIELDANKVPKSYVDTLFNLYYDKGGNVKTKTLGRCRYEISRFQPVGRVHQKTARSQGTTISTGEAFTLRLY